MEIQLCQLRISGNVTDLPVSTTIRHPVSRCVPNKERCFVQLEAQRGNQKSSIQVSPAYICREYFIKKSNDAFNHVIVDNKSTFHDADAVLAFVRTITAKLSDSAQIDVHNKHLHKNQNVYETYHIWLSL